MKKLLKLASFLAIACISFAGCSDSDDPEPKPEPTKLSLAISVSSQSIIINGEATITVKASSAVKEALVVNIASDNAAVTVPATLTIEKGKDVVTGVAKGVSVGNAKLTITANNVGYSVQSVNVNVSEASATTPALSISSVSSFIKPGNTAEFTVTSTVAPKADLTITLTSDHPEFATVPASVVMKAGETTVSGTITAVAIGTASISIAAEGVDIAKKAVEITVSETEAAKIGKLYATAKITPTATFTNLICEYDGLKVYPGSLYYHEYGADGKPSGIFKSSIDVYGGNVVGKVVDGEVFFTPVEEGTLIDDNLTWQLYKNTFSRFPILVKDKDAVNSISDGTHFVVVALPKDGDPTKIEDGWNLAVNVPCWMKIKVTGLGIEVLDGAMLLNDAPFKVGQKK